MNMLSGSIDRSAPKSRSRSNEPSSMRSLRFCCQTKKMVEPGRYSQRSTAFNRSDWTLKSLSENEVLGSPSPFQSM